MITYYEYVPGNDEKAVQILKSLGRTDPNDINKVLSSKEEKTITFMSQWTELFYKKSNRRALFIVLILLILQQFSGANVVTLFATQIFHMAGSTVAPHIATIIVGVTRLTGACIAPITVERAGRKVLLLISTSLCCLSLVSFLLFTRSTHLLPYFATYFAKTSLFSIILLVHNCIRDGTGYRLQWPME